MRLRYWPVIGAFCLSAAGCGGNDLVVKKQMEMDARLEQLAQGNVAANARITDLANEVSELQRQVKAASTDIEAMKPGHREMKASIDSLEQKLAAITPRAPTPKIELVNGEAAPSDRDAAIQDAYMKAFGLFSANKYSEAIEAFGAFITAHPASEYAGNAMYWVGECYYTQNDYSQALESFSKMVATYPKGNKVPDAMLKIGYSLVGMNEQVKARAALQSLLVKYPKSQAAAKARERLGRL